MADGVENHDVARPVDCKCTFGNLPSGRPVNFYITAVNSAPINTMFIIVAG
jgi:hypothetical protein